jgi:hypothetical protein
MKTRLLLVLLALPLAAFDCGGEKKVLPQCPSSCRLHVGGAVNEDLCCVVFAHDFSQDPVPEGFTPVNDWSFMLTAFRTDLAEEAATVGMFIEGRPVLATVYGWDGAVCTTTTIFSATAIRFAWIAGPQPYAYPTHSADLWDGTGELSLTFTEIPPPTAVGEQQLGVHGGLTATLPPDSFFGPGTGDPVTLSATF